MGGFGSLWRVRTRKHIRTMYSLTTATGPGRRRWPRFRETVRLLEEERRLGLRRSLHAARQAIQGLLGKEDWEE